jgi:quercetin dioxygenase-like cupin family protein
MAQSASAPAAISLQPGEGPSVWVLGDLYTFKINSEDTGGAFAVLESTIAPQNGPPPHLHRNEDESFYVISGDFSFLLGGTQIAAAAGAMVHVPRGSVHTFKNVGAVPGRLLVTVAPGGLEKFFAEFGDPATDPAGPPPASPPDMEKLMALAAKYGIEIQPAG